MMKHQQKYTNELVEMFEMDNIKTIYTPTTTTTKLDIDESCSPIDEKLQRVMIDFWLFLTASKLDIILGFMLSSNKIQMSHI